MVASLLLLGDGAFASELNQRSDIEALANDITSQISQQTDPGNSGPEWQTVLMVANAILPLNDPENLTFAALAPTVSGTLKYSPSNPRAPPLPAK